MVVISDTSPLITLLKINRLDLLKKIFKEVEVPEAVYKELITKKYNKEAKQIKEANFIKIKKVDKKKTDSIIKEYSLDKGESEAIVLALNYKECLLIVDEIKARNIAIKIGLKIMGSIGILMYSFEKGFINKEEIISYIEICKVNNRYISENLYNKLLEKCEMK